MKIVYHGVVHNTNTIQSYEFPENLPVIDILKFFAGMNRESHIYGITYYLPESEINKVLDPNYAKT